MVSPTGTNQVSSRLSPRWSPGAAVVVLAVLLAFAGVSCEPTPVVRGSSFRVVVISLDGLRPDAITAANAPTLMRLIQEGAATLTAQTVLPSLTLPAHTSMVTGLVPERHGITWNDDTSPPEPVDLITIFDYATRAGYTSAMFVGKSKLIPLVHPGAPTKVSIPPVGQVWGSEIVSAQVREYLSAATARPNLLFIHFPDIDAAGHAYGWMSTQYLAAVQHADSGVARVWQAAKQTFGSDLTLIVTADHGGVGGGHAEGSRLSTTIPWIAWGNGVTPKILSSDTRGVDTGPTALWLLGLSPPTDWDGVPVTSAFPALAP
ncbi:MAG: alkaline phosphatase family protein [Gemmatimonadetes bacterium]|nr:alkaline phosphatase family protein [Gemmatimonadota bacterium]